MVSIIVTGQGTDVGKTVVSAILCTALKGDYWKPIGCGNSDAEVIRTLLDEKTHRIHPSAYTFQAPLSPHHAARLENREVNPSQLHPPKTENPLIIETAGGVLVPLTIRYLTLDHFQHWQAKWVVVSRHYLGSINHTLLTIEALKRRKVPILGMIFNGDPHPDSEEVILQITQLPLLGRLFQEKTIHPSTIQRYAHQWQVTLLQQLQNS